MRPSSSKNEGTASFRILDGLEDRTLAQALGEESLHSAVGQVSDLPFPEGRVEDTVPAFDLVEQRPGFIYFGQGATAYRGLQFSSGAMIDRVSAIWSRSTPLGPGSNSKNMASMSIS